MKNKLLYNEVENLFLVQHRIHRGKMENLPAVPAGGIPDFVEHRANSAYCPYVSYAVEPIRQLGDPSSSDLAFSFWSTRGRMDQLKQIRRIISRFCTQKNILVSKNGVFISNREWTQTVMNNKWTKSGKTQFKTPPIPASLGASLPFRIGSPIAANSWLIHTCDRGFIIPHRSWF